MSRHANRMEESLRNSAPQPMAPPHFMHARIMNAVKSTPPPLPSSFWRLALPWAGAAVVGVILISLAMTRSQHARPQSITAREEKRAPQAWTIATFEAPKISGQQPLELELASLEADTRNAARALIENFLPSEFSR